MKTLSIITAIAPILFAGAASAASITADTVLEYDVEGTTSGVDMSGVLVDDGLFVSLPTYDNGNSNSFVTLGFSTGYVFDATGQNDLFIGEIGNGAEDADIFVSQDFGSTFTLLGTAFGNQISEFDLDTLPSGFKVNAVKVVGLDRGGSSPGFDLDFVRGLEGSSVEEPQGPDVVPLPASLPLLLAGLGGTVLLRRRR